MNTALALEIYRGLWVVESSRVDALKNVLRDARMPGVVYDPSQKLNTFALMNISAGPSSPYQTASAGSKTQSKIAVTNINGVITQSGGSSSRGMEELSVDMIAADNDPDVIGHYIKVNSPGGSERGMVYMQNTMKSLTKPIVTMVTRQGMAASGGYGILSHGHYVMAESEDAEVGSVGVMWGVSGVPNGEKDGNGEVHFVVVSSTSPDKNAAPLSAINTGDTKLMEAEVNKRHVGFKASTKSARPTIKDEHMTGAMYPAIDVVGSMVDAIGTEQEALNKVLELSKAKTTFNKNLNNNTKKAMTAQELLAQHPTVHAEIFGAGVAAGRLKGTEAEQERVKSWQVYASVDPEAVNKGIASGKAISASERENLLFKATSKNTLDSLKNNSNPTVTLGESETAEVTPEVVAQKKEVEDLFALATFNKN